jgi:hypothetical protein
MRYSGMARHLLQVQPKIRCKPVQAQAQGWTRDGGGGGGTGAYEERPFDDDALVLLDWPCGNRAISGFPWAGGLPCLASALHGSRHVGEFWGRGMCCYRACQARGSLGQGCGERRECVMVCAG